MLLAGGCGPSESTKRIRTLTLADCQAIQTKVAKLCEGYVPSKNDGDDLMDGLLFGDKIPKELAYLKPQAVRIERNFLEIYLYKTPAGEDSIHVYRDKDGTWTIETHEGSWKNVSKVIWSSKNS